MFNLLGPAQIYSLANFCVGESSAFRLADSFMSILFELSFGTDRDPAYTAGHQSVVFVKSLDQRLSRIERFVLRHGDVYA